MNEKKSWKQLKLWQYHVFQLYDHVSTFVAIGILIFLLYYQHDQRTSSQLIVILVIGLSMILKLSYTNEIFNKKYRDVPLTLQQYRCLQLLVYLPLVGLSPIAFFSIFIGGIISKLICAGAVIIIGVSIWFILSLKINESELINERDLDDE